ncbi:seminal metalloprotease 1-like [Drosophila kikkawai]|uniref:Metalloendopeptidase n=1 Tax=Drosophila kikkawai TaxID=30033 RepID=A0ABM3C675_DROKI|nr:seminal metalloprotease 1-like [Drosophila kikkawai]
MHYNALAFSVNGLPTMKALKAEDAPFAEYIEQAMRIIELSSCVRFVPATDEEVYLFAIPSTNGCSANLGYGKKVRFLYLTPVGLDKGCFKIPVIQHELLHILGFQHQQSSPDRDEYVMIMEENIIEGREHNFAKLDSSKYGNYDQPYDYGSLLHYAPYAFSKNGEPTIVALNPEGQSQMGQRVKMSEVDINRLNTMYKCPIQT